MSNLKRGPKPYTEASDKLVPVSVIANRLEISVATVNRDLKSAMCKMWFAFVLYKLATEVL